MNHITNHKLFIDFENELSTNHKSAEYDSKSWFDLLIIDLCPVLVQLPLIWMADFQRNSCRRLGLLKETRWLSITPALKLLSRSWVCTQKWTKVEWIIFWDIIDDKKQCCHLPPWCINCGEGSKHFCLIHLAYFNSYVENISVQDGKTYNFLSKTFYQFFKQSQYLCHWTRKVRNWRANFATRRMPRHYK